MDKITYEGMTMAAVKQLKSDYDNSCKRVLALKEICARVLKESVREFKDMSVDKIIECIGDREISVFPVDRNAPEITQENSEDSSLKEGTRFFDIRFTVRLPGKNNEYVYLIINIEAQKNSFPGYSVIKRGIYYCSRLVSSQYGTVFTGSDYNKIRKVYSIWICTDPSAEYRNVIREFSMSGKTLFGRVKFKNDDDREKEHSDYDMLSLVIIGLGDPKDKSLKSGSLIKLLSLIFNQSVDYSQLKITLESEYNIKMTREANEEVENMCNLSESVWERGVSKGMTEGMAKGITKGRAEGITKGRAEGITKGRAEGMAKGRAEGKLEQITESIRTLMSKNMSFDDAVDLLDITPEYADKVRNKLGKPLA